LLLLHCFNQWNYNLAISNAVMIVAVIGRMNNRRREAGFFSSLLYFLGLRYIEELNSNIATIFVNYELSPKYTIIAEKDKLFKIVQKPKK